MLKQLNITNLKSIEKAELKLASLTLLIGANSVGKSTALQALMLLIKNSHPANGYSMEEMLRYLDDFTVIRNKKTNARNVYLEVIDNEKSFNTLEILADEIRSNSELSYKFEWANNAEEPELLYLNANRIGAQELVPTSSRKVGARGELLFSHFEKIKGCSLPDNLAKFEGSKTIAYQLSQWLSFITDSKLELVTEQIGDHVKVSFNVKDIVANVSPFNLGVGVSYVAKVLIICLMAKKGDLVLIENPEVQLHPKSQALLGVFLSFIARNGIQLIVETHCEHLINKIRVEVSEENIDAEDVVIHYKASTEDPFQTLYLDVNGHFVDKEENRLCFPKGFFDASLDALLSLR